MCVHPVGFLFSLTVVPFGWVLLKNLFLNLPHPRRVLSAAFGLAPLSLFWKISLIKMRIVDGENIQTLLKISYEWLSRASSEEGILGSVIAESMNVLHIITKL